MSTDSRNISTVQSTAQAESLQVLRVLRPNLEEEAFYKDSTLGIEESLQAHPMIRDIKMIMRPPVPISAITAWERKHGVKLPPDLKNYYSSMNGFKLTWNLDYAGDLLKIGDLCVNSLNELNPVDTGFSDNPNASVVPGNTTSVDEKWGAPAVGAASKPVDSYLRISFEVLHQTLETAKKNSKRSKVNTLTPGTKGKAFLLDSSHPELGTACLVYPVGSSASVVMRNLKVDDSYSSSQLEQKNEPDVQIWFLDPSYQWHFLAPTFSHYYRMLLYHQGMPQWQYRFTPFGISAWAEQMFWLVTPHLLQPEKISAVPTSVDSTIWSLDVPADAGCPNPTKNVINTSIFRKKKKDKKPV